MHPLLKRKIQESHPSTEIFFYNPMAMIPKDPITKNIKRKKIINKYKPQLRTKSRNGEHVPATRDSSRSQVHNNNISNHVLKDT